MKPLLQIKCADRLTVETALHTAKTGAERAFEEMVEVAGGDPRVLAKIAEARENIEKAYRDQLLEVRSA
jgi:uncharacterized protein (UPF0297 family)